MKDLAELTLDGFLDRVAERTPTPGGGSVAALAGALSCAMARMVTAYSVGKKTDEARRVRVDSMACRLKLADDLLRALVTRDGLAYSEMTAARESLEKGAMDRAGFDQAVLNAIAVPMELATAAAAALKAMDELKDDASRYLLSDLGVAAVLADAAGEAAAYTIRVNAGELADARLRSRILTDLEQTLQHGTAHRNSVETYVRGSLEFEDRPAGGR